MGSLISSANDSSWKYVACTDCEGKFENKIDMEYHKQRIHTYGETYLVKGYKCNTRRFQRSSLPFLAHLLNSENRK